MFFLSVALFQDYIFKDLEFRNINYFHCKQIVSDIDFQCKFRKFKIQIDFVVETFITRRL